MKPNHVGAGVAWLLLAACAVVGAQERREVPEFRVFGEAPAEAVAGVNALVAEFRRAWGAEDVAALMALHSDDTEWINAYARMFRGADALGHFLEHKLFPEFDPGVSEREAANMTLISIRYLEDDAAVVHLYTDGDRGESRNADEALRRTHIHLMLAGSGSEWKIVHTAIMDAR